MVLILGHRGSKPTVFAASLKVIRHIRLRHISSVMGVIASQWPHSQYQTEHTQIILILPNWAGSWYKHVKVCSWHPGTRGYRAILNLRVEVYCRASNLASEGLWKNKSCWFLHVLISCQRAGHYVPARESQAIAWCPGMLAGKPEATSLTSLEQIRASKSNGSKLKK